MKPENVETYVSAMLGDAVSFAEECYSIYISRCRRMEHFVHDHVLFAGDSAHLVSPFGARDCKGGFANVNDLGWKLDLLVNHIGDHAPILEALALAGVEGKS